MDFGLWLISFGIVALVRSVGRLPVAAVNRTIRETEMRLPESLQRWLFIRRLERSGYEIWPAADLLEQPFVRWIELGVQPDLAATGPDFEPVMIQFRESVTSLDVVRLWAAVRDRHDEEAGCLVVRVPPPLDIKKYATELGIGLIGYQETVPDELHAQGVTTLA